MFGILGVTIAGENDCPPPPITIGFLGIFIDIIPMFPALPKFPPFIAFPVVEGTPCNCLLLSTFIFLDDIARVLNLPFIFVFLVFAFFDIFVFFVFMFMF
eukprot:903227_1